MKIKQLIESDNGGIRASFYIDDDGTLMIEFDDELLEVPNPVAVELIHFLAGKLHEHQQKNESLLKRLFR